MTPMPLSLMIGSAFFAGSVFAFTVFCYLKLDGNDFRAVAYHLMYTSICMLAGIGVKGFL